jgi:hypothetical protein
MLNKASKTTIALMMTGAAVAALAGCSGATTTAAVTTGANAGASDPSGGTTASSLATPTTRATTSAAVAVGAIPTKCKSLMSATTYKKDGFAKTPLTQPSAPKTQLSAAVKSGGASIFCLWRDPRADISGISIQVVTVDSSKALAQLKKLPAKGFTCKKASDAYTCQKIGRDSQYPVETGDTYYTRGDIGIRIQQANVPTSGLLKEVVARVF